ncbi:MAG TPA: NAD-dependent epimerase/dehydratase family protein [Gemmatimonadaceae bacterium]|nr:NAD-dependent epimerase/dehydratase family protein [Gemmatimonadaceae bacterium]
MTVLVTGGAGFIGSHLSERLISRGQGIVIVDSFDPYYDPAIKHRNIETVLESGRARLIIADICDRDAVERALEDEHIDAIVHLAARAGVRPSLENPEAYVRTNVEGTAAMLELARRRGVRAFVMGSSSSIYGDSTPVPFTEDAPAVTPISPYAATKRAAELLCHTFAHLYGLSIVCLRLFTVYGPRQRPDLAIHKFARLMSSDKSIPFYGDGATERDYTYVDDVVDGIEGALRWAKSAKPGAFEIVNLGENTTTSLARLVEMLAAELGVTPTLDRMPPQPGDVQRTFASVEKAHRLLGYNPHTPMEEGIRRFVEWFRQQPPV